MWCVPYEREYLKEHWYSSPEDMEGEKYAMRYKALVKGLDSESIRTVEKILVRQKMILSKKDYRIDFYTEEEQAELKKMKKEFTMSRLKLKEDLWAYHGKLLPGDFFTASVYYYRHGVDKLTTLSSIREKSIIDVGGFVGDSLPVLAEWGGKDIYTFECMPDNFVLLKKTIELNNLKNVYPQNVALSNSVGNTKMTKNMSASSISEAEGEIEVSTTTLDEFVKANNVKVGLIKVDIEGAEPLFLEGAKNTICEQKPILLISIYHNSHDFFELKPLIESWNLGYTFQIYHPTNGYTYNETLLIAEVCDVQPNNNSVDV